MKLDKINLTFINFGESGKKSAETDISHLYYLKKVIL